MPPSGMLWGALALLLSLVAALVVVRLDYFEKDGRTRAHKWLRGLLLAAVAGAALASAVALYGDTRETEHLKSDLAAVRTKLEASEHERIEQQQRSATAAQQNDLDRKSARLGMNFELRQVLRELLVPWEELYLLARRSGLPRLAREPTCDDLQSKDFARFAANFDLRTRMPGSQDTWLHHFAVSTKRGLDDWDEVLTHSQSIGVMAVTRSRLLAVKLDGTVVALMEFDRKGGPGRGKVTLLTIPPWAPGILPEESVTNVEGTVCRIMKDVVDEFPKERGSFPVTDQ